MSINAIPIPTLKKSEIDRFWSKVAPTANPDKCWEWLAGKDQCGYGKMSITLSLNKEKLIPAHRISYFIENKSIDRDKVVMHTCDNPGCVNPKHLLLGTTKDNVMDRAAKGRNRNQLGEANNQSKLKSIDIINIRILLTKGESQTTIAKKYKVSRRLISFIKTKKRWGYII